MTVDEFFDAPETPGRRSKWEQWGYHYFKDGLLKANVDFLEPNASEPSIIRVAGRPVFDASGQAQDVMPFLRARPSRRLSDPADRLFAPTVCYPICVVRYMGPRPGMDDDNRRDGPPQLHFISEWAPGIRRQRAQEGRPLDPTCMDILLARAPGVVARNPRFKPLFKADDDFNSCLRRPTTVWILNGLCLQHGKVECDEDNPLPSISLLTWTGRQSFMDLVLTEREGYVYPEGADHSSISTREELNRRFVHADLTNPAGAKAVILTSHKQKRKSSKGGKGERGAMEGNRYVATLTDDLYPFPAELQAKMWTPPEDLFWYPTPAETFELLLNNAGDADWYDFLIELAKGTDLEQPERVQGVSVEREPSVNSQGVDSDVNDYMDDGEDVFVPPAEAAPRPGPDSPSPAPGGVRTLGLGSDFGKRRPGDPLLSSEEKGAAVRTDVAPPPDMPLPEPSAVFGDAPAAAAPADTPESVEARTAAAKARLEQMRQGR